MDVFRTPSERFAAWVDYPFGPNYIPFAAGFAFGDDEIPPRMHYVDEGRSTGPVALLLHGMPTSSYLYRRMIPPLVEAGYRCIAPDYIGFGKSDKILDDEWYTIARHCDSITGLIQELDLKRITVFCQDWGGPIGLRQAVAMPDRFERLAIMNTWLHNPTHEYTDAIRAWNASWHEGGRQYELQGCGFILQNFLATQPSGSTPLTPERAFAAYEAPFPDAGSKAGPRRFPLSLPFDDPEAGNAEVQARDFEALKAWRKPAHFLWGVVDQVFTEEWGRAWAAQVPGATFDAFEAGHFLQESHGPEIVEVFLSRVRDG